MKLSKKSCILFLILVSFLLAESPLALDLSGDRYLNIKPEGPISVRVGESLALTLTVENTDISPRFLKEVTITVIDPFNGTRLYGPDNLPINRTIAPQAVVSGTISIGPFDASQQDLTAGAIIFAVGNSDEIIGYSGWGFVIE